MADTPWTPGPWEWNNEEYFQQFCGDFSSTAVYAPGNAFHWRMCEVQGPNDETEIANARLIAAAPEYDELLGEAIDIFEGDLTGVEWKRAWRDFTHRAKALRSKARGEQ